MSMVVESEENGGDRGVLNGPPQELMDELELRGLQATVLKINRFGTAIAIGTTCGIIVITDYITKLPVLELKDHALPITAIDWSHDGRRLASADENGVYVVDVLTKEVIHGFSTQHLNTSVCFHPRNSDIITYLTKSGTVQSRKLSEKKPINYEVRSQYSDDCITAICYYKRGKYLIAGTNKSYLIFFDGSTFKYVKHVKISNNHQVRQICVSKAGDYIATNSSDRCIRVFEFSRVFSGNNGQTISHACKFVDAVSKRNYLYISFSPDARYICSTEQNNHEITIWDIRNGSVAPPLRGKTLGDAPTDLQWHPKRMEILTVARGKVHIFGRRCFTTMTAFAPDFKEINDNAIYEEEEGSFDLYDEDASLPDRKPQPDVAVDIEQLTALEMPWNSSDEEGIDWKEALKGKKGPLVIIPTTIPLLPLDEQPDDEMDTYCEGFASDCAELNQKLNSSSETISPAKKKTDDEIFVKPKLPKEEPISRSSSRTGSVSHDSSEAFDMKSTRAKKPRMPFDASK